MQNLALIVDDDRQTLLFLQQVLTPLNVEVIQAEDGNQAISILQQTTPSILFLDLLLPGVTGFDVLEFVANSPALNDMYVVVLSAHNNAQPATLPRADTYLVKPVRVQVIRDIAQLAALRQVTR